MTQAIEPKLPFAVRKSIRDGYDPYVEKLKTESKRLLGTEWTMEVPWARLLEEAGNESCYFTNNPGEAMAGLMSDALDQIKYQSKDGADALFLEALDEAAPSHIISCKTNDNLGSMSGCELSDGKLYLVFKSAKVAPGYFGCNSGSTLDTLQSLL